MVSWNEFQKALKERVKGKLRVSEEEESNFQFGKAMSETLKELFIQEEVMKRKKLPYDHDKQRPGKHVLYRDDSVKKVRR